MRVLFTSRGSEGHLGPLVPYATACRSAGLELLMASQDRFEDDANAYRQPRNLADLLLFQSRQRIEKTFAALPRVEFLQRLEFVIHLCTTKKSLNFS